MFNIYSLYPCPEYNLNKGRGLVCFVFNTDTQ